MVPALHRAAPRAQADDRRAHHVDTGCASWPSASPASRSSRCGCACRSVGAGRRTRPAPRCSRTRCSPAPGSTTAPASPPPCRRSAAICGVGVDADRLLVGGNALATGLPGLLDLLALVLTEPTIRTGRDRDRARPSDRAAVHRSLARGRRSRGSGWPRGCGATHPYALDLPQPEAVAATTPAQIRALHRGSRPSRRSRAHHRRRRLAERVLDQVERALAAWTGDASRPRVPKLPSPPGGPLLVVDRAGSVQSSLRMGTAAVTPHRPALPGAATGEPDLRRLLLLALDGEHPRGQGLHLRAAQPHRPPRARLRPHARRGGRDRGDRAGRSRDELRAGSDRRPAGHEERGRLGAPVRDRQPGPLDGDAGRPRLDAVGARRRSASAWTGSSNTRPGWRR